MTHAHAGAGAPEPIAFAVITVSDTRTVENDASGRLARTRIEEAGHRVAWSEIVRDEANAIRAVVDRALDDAEVGIVFLTGGTGISPRDTTPDALASVFERELPGFGELFRAYSLEEIGTATFLSRACAGIARGKAIFAAPGSRGAVQCALARIVLPEARHLAAELRKGG